jgi:transposase
MLDTKSMKNDGRKFDHKTLEQIRGMAVRRVQAGESPSEVVASFGFSRTSIYRWLGKTEKELASRKAAGPERRLSVKQVSSLKKMILKSDPRSHGFDSALWSTGIISALIKTKFQMSLSRVSVFNTLRREGLTPRKPLRRAYERDPKLIEEWKTETLPDIVKRAKKRGALILFLDEAGIVSDAPLGKTWGERAQRTEIRTSGQRQKVNVLSGVSPSGTFRYEVYSHRFTASFFVEVLKKFSRRIRRPVFFVVDRHPVHRAKIVKDYVKSTKGKVELYFLPPYAPDLNPDEFVWNQLKTHGLCKKPLKANESLRDRVKADLEALAKDKTLMRSFFKAKSVAYPT